MNKTIGEKLKDQRISLGISLVKASSDLKIRQEYLESLEKNDYTVFSSDIYAKGFLKSYSKYLKLDSENFAAIFRRDVQGSKLINNKDKTISVQNNTFLLSQKGIRLAIVFTILVIVIYGLFSLLNQAFKKPYLEITQPYYVVADSRFEQKSDTQTIYIEGKTESGTIVKINGVLLPLNTDRSFKSDLLPTSQEQNYYLIEAISNVGVTSKIELILNREKTNSSSNLIIGAIQVLDGELNIKIVSDGNTVTESKFFENDSIPVAAQSSIEIYSDNPNNLKIFLNGSEYKMLSNTLKLNLNGDKLEEVK